ncbi:MAG: hypothetical protein CTY33_05910 [Methylotenera sp.]|nr:MAG: hypothetical protein CTY33_05910 [Methylotenera sp.]
MVNQRHIWSDEDQLTPRLAAIYLGGSNKPLALNTLALWRRKNIGPKYIKVGKSVRYPISGLKEFVVAMTVNPAMSGACYD